MGGQAWLRILRATRVPTPHTATARTEEMWLQTAVARGLSRGRGARQDTDGGVLAARDPMSIRPGPSLPGSAGSPGSGWSGCRKLGTPDSGPQADAAHTLYTSDLPAVQSSRRITWLAAMQPPRAR